MTATTAYRFSVTVPAGTAEGAGWTSPLTLPAASTVNRVSLRVPAGPNGTLGVALTMAGVQIIPFGPAAWIVANDETITWDLLDLPDSGAWVLAAYNAGVFDHTVQVAFDVSPTPTPPAQQLLIASSALSSVGP